MNFKNSEFLMLVAAFLLGYFVQEMMKGCQVMEGLEESITESERKNIVDFAEEASSAEDLAKAELIQLQTNYVDSDFSKCMNLQTTLLTGGQYDKDSVDNCLDELIQHQTNYVDGDFSDFSECMNLQTTRLTGGQYNKNSVKNCLDQLCGKYIIPPPAATTCEKAGDRCYDGGNCGQRFCGYAEGRESISENDPGSERLQGPLGCNIG